MMAGDTNVNRTLKGCSPQMEAAKSTIETSCTQGDKAHSSSTLAIDNGASPEGVVSCDCGRVAFGRRFKSGTKELFSVDSM